MLSHLDENGLPTMVDVGQKAVTLRTATARAVVDFPQDVFDQLLQGKELVGKKGSVFATAIVAGIQGAKRTSELIPMCHPLPVEKIAVTCEVWGSHEVQVLCTVKVTHKTGVEMEALTGACVAALTIYDMTKSLSHAIVIRSVQLVTKTGGKSDFGEHDHGS